MKAEATANGISNVTKNYEAISMLENQKNRRR